MSVEIREVRPSLCSTAQSTTTSQKSAQKSIKEHVELVQHGRTNTEIDRCARRKIRNMSHELVSLAHKQGHVTCETVVEAAQKLTGKPITLHPIDFSATEIFGMWLALPTANLIFFEHNTSPVHQTHIIQHELGHIVLGHRGISSRNVNKSSHRRLRKTIRHGITTIQEAEAEEFAIRMTRLLHMESIQQAPTKHSTVASRITSMLAGGRSCGFL